jgi:hypothetical protein
VEKDLRNKRSGRQREDTKRSWWNKIMKGTSSHYLLMSNRPRTGLQ